MTNRERIGRLETRVDALSDSINEMRTNFRFWSNMAIIVPRQPILPDASIDFAALTPSLTVDSALHRYDNL